MTASELSLDLVLTTAPDFHDNYPYILALQRDGTLVVVGTLAPFAKPTDNSKVAIQRWSVARSLIGGVAETPEVLDFCAEHGTQAEVPVDRLQMEWGNVLRSGFKTIYVASPAIVERGKEDGRIGAEGEPCESDALRSIRRPQRSDGWP